MKNVIDNTILSNNNISVRKKSSLLPIAILVIGAITFAVSLYLNNENIKTPVLFIAIIILIFGIAKIFTMPDVLVYNPSNEELNEEELYFGSDEKNNVIRLLREGDIAGLRSIAKKDSNQPLMVELYTVNSVKTSIYRIYHYVPYAYEPLTGYEVYKRA